MIYLVRHGRSNWNAAAIVQGRTPHPFLTPTGGTESRTAAELIAHDARDHGQQVRVLLASDLRRAMQTAQLIGEALGLAPQAVSGLREQSLGMFEGRPAAEVSGMVSTDTWHDPDAAIGGGETAREVYHRMTDALLPFRDTAYATVAVSHGLAMRCFLIGRDMMSISAPGPRSGAVVAVGPADRARFLGPSASASGDIITF